MDKVQIKKQNNTLFNLNELQELSKEELIEKLQALQAHNTQLKNIIAKNQIDKVNEFSNQKTFNFNNCFTPLFGCSCSYRRILLKLFYLGWDYNGFVVQEDTNKTIEYHLFKALIKTCLIKDRSTSNYHRCGRTDKGVSSYGQVISITLRSKLNKNDQYKLDDEINYCKVLNCVLPDNIQCVAWSPVDEEFSARFNCKKRVYKYYFPKGNLNIEEMKTGASYLLGSHDFRNFCKMDVSNGVVQFIRNIINIEIECIDKCQSEEYSMYVLKIEGNAFLWHQIRCIIGVLFLIGQNKETPNVIKELLDVNINPRKPEYNMASEIPLNLYECDYESINWFYNEESLKMVINKLKAIWTINSIKTTMIKNMLDDLVSDVKEINNDIFIDCLVPGVKVKKYVPLMKRQKCGTYTLIQL